MKKVIASVLIFSCLSSAAYADCDFSKGITPGPNHTFIYSEECHQKVGQLIQDNATKDKQIADYVQAINLKDLAITKADSRTQLWMDTSDKLTDRLTKVDELQKKNDWLYFGLGVLSTVAVGFMTARLIGR